MSAPTPPALDADLTAGLRRLKLAAMRALAPELLITARDASNERARLKSATFPVVKTIEQFDLAASSIPAPTLAYLTTLEWIHARENLALIGPAGTGKSHTLIALGHAAVTAGHRVEYLTAAELVETLYRGLADNTVGKTIETLLRNDLVLVDEIGLRPWTTPAPNSSSGSSPPPTNADPWASPPTHSFEDWGRFLPDHGTTVSMLPRTRGHPQTGSCTTPPPWSPPASPTACSKPDNEQDPPSK